MNKWNKYILFSLELAFTESLLKSFKVNLCKENIPIKKIHFKVASMKVVFIITAYKAFQLLYIPTSFKLWLFTRLR